MTAFGATLQGKVFMARLGNAGPDSAARGAAAHGAARQGFHGETALGSEGPDVARTGVAWQDSAQRDNARLDMAVQGKV